MATNCTGNVIRMTTIKGVKVDAEPHRTVTVHLTRCTGCAGTAQVEDDDGLRLNVWNGLELPMDYRSNDEMAAYWAAAQTAYTHPDRQVPHYTEAPVDPDWDEEAEWDGYVEDEDGDLAYALMLERNAERGTWFGNDPF